MCGMKLDKLMTHIRIWWKKKLREANKTKLKLSSKGRICEKSKEKRKKKKKITKNQEEV